ncbi:type IV pilus biogenesis protein PilM [Pseudomonas phoenicis]|uniref:type IV pilus biogenesis protein PilM n=1 Tax=unclassified Pseudomonas TaxID=196821 RepID=UPI0039A054C1
MLGRIGRDASSPLAVQIAHDSIRILQLSRHRGRPRVSAWALEPLERPALAVGAEQCLAALEAPLRRAVNRCASRQRQVAMALSAGQVMCKRCVLPAGLRDDALERQLLAQAEQLFPVPLDDLALDFQVLGPATTPGELDVLVAACRQSVLDPFEQLCASAGLQMVAMEIDSLALRRLMPAQGRALLVLERDDIVLHRWPEAAAPVHRCLVQSPFDLDDMGWSAHLGSVLGGDAQRLCLTGALASADLAERLAGELAMPCEPLAPLQGLDLGTDMDETQAGCMALPYGLALGGLQ